MIHFFYPPFLNNLFLSEETRNMSFSTSVEVRHMKRLSVDEWRLVSTFSVVCCFCWCKNVKVCMSLASMRAKKKQKKVWCHRKLQERVDLKEKDFFYHAAFFICYISVVRGRGLLFMAPPTSVAMETFLKSIDCLSVRCGWQFNCDQHLKSVPVKNTRSSFKAVTTRFLSVL